MKKENTPQSTDLGDPAFEKMLSIVFDDMMSRHSDPEVGRIKSIYSGDTSKSDRLLSSLSDASGIKAGAAIMKRIQTYPEIYDNFKGGEWDHKVPAKEISDSYYSKQEKNKDGQSAVIFGGKIPSDDKNIYDHDFWGNISYGYTLRVAGMSEAELRATAIGDDVLQSKDLLNPDFKDDDMVAFGSLLYDKYGDKMTKDDLRREIIANKHKFRKYPIESLEKRSVRSQDGDTLEQIAKREGVSVKDIQKQLEKDAEQNSKLYGNINDQMSLMGGVKVNLPRAEDREPVPIALNGPNVFAPNVGKESKDMNANNGTITAPEAKDAIPSSDKDMNTANAGQESKESPLSAEATKIFEAFKNNDNKSEDILLKPSKDLTYGEITQAQKAALFDVKDKEVQQSFFDKITDFFETFYGKEKVKYDAMGKMIRPEPLMPIPEDTKEVATKDNMPMMKAFQQLAENVVDGGAKALQRGLNLFDFSPALKEDGVIGPKTTFRTKEALVKNGFDTVKNNANIGAFENMVTDNRKKEIPQESLKETVSKIGSTAGQTLQQGLNSLGQNKEGYQPLQEDNDIGPKTTAVFNQLKDEEEEGITGLFRPTKFAGWMKK